MMASDWYILDGEGNPVPSTTEEWDKWWRTVPDPRRIARDKVNGKLISTVFLGLDHRCHGIDPDGPPILFETLVFPSEDKLLEEDGERYCTRDQAIEGHRRYVAGLKERGHVAKAAKTKQVDGLVGCEFIVGCIEACRVMTQAATSPVGADKAEAQLADLRAKANDSVAILRRVDDYFDRNMKLETSEEFQRLRHQVTKGISDEAER